MQRLGFLSEYALPPHKRSVSMRLPNAGGDGGVTVSVSCDTRVEGIASTVRLAVSMSERRLVSSEALLVVVSFIYLARRFVAFFVPVK